MKTQCRQSAHVGWVHSTLYTHEAASDLRLPDKATKVFVVTSTASAEYCSLLLGGVARYLLRVLRSCC